MPSQRSSVRVQSSIGNDKEPSSTWRLTRSIRGRDGVKSDRIGVLHDDSNLFILIDVVNSWGGFFFIRVRGCLVGNPLRPLAGSSHRRRSSKVTAVGDQI